MVIILLNTLLFYFIRGGIEEVKSRIYIRRSWLVWRFFDSYGDYGSLPIE